MKFGERLREWREAKGVSTYKVQKEADIPASNLISIEKGRRPASDAVLIALASIPEMDIDYSTLKSWQLEDKFGVSLADLTRKD